MSEGTTVPDLVLDCRGMACPMPVVELGRRIGEVPVGSVVAVEADDVAARVDVPAWCRMRAQEYLGEEAAADGEVLDEVVRGDLESLKSLSIEGIRTIQFVPPYDTTGRFGQTLQGGAIVIRTH